MIPSHPSLLAIVRPLWQEIEDKVALNVERTVKAFSTSGLSAPDLMGSTGYGYDDRGRSLLDGIVADIMGTPAALVRSQWVSGTHALNTVLQSLAPSVQKIWIASGPVYDTLHPIMFDRNHPFSLVSRGIDIEYMQWDRDGMPIWQSHRNPDVVYIQRSRGYQARPSWGRRQIEHIIGEAHRRNAIVVVDNCYGEFTDIAEPGHWGADLVVGSMMKNPGAGIAPTGAYVAGTESLVERVADQLFAPGIGGEVGPTGPYQRLLAQGWFMAPQVVGEAVMGGIYVSALFEAAGFAVNPLAREARNDIVTAIQLRSPQEIVRFCEQIQLHSPVDAKAAPTPWDMPGYHDPVIMAAGGFVSGASLELSADAPIRAPYWVYLQGGLSRWHTIIAARAALESLIGAN